MPIPKPKKRETKNEYVSRFMSNNRMQKEYPKMKKRLAIAYSTWRKK